jgi:hypothetical protein
MAWDQLTHPFVFTIGPAAAWRATTSSAGWWHPAWPPDVVLHVDDCALALHTRVLRRRGYGLNKKILSPHAM